jgi:hypothetical protein
MDATVDEARRAAKQYWEWRDSTWLNGEPLTVPKEINSLLWKAVKDIKCAPDPFCRSSPRLNAFRDLMAPSAWHAACYLILHDLASRYIKASFESDEAFETNESKASDEVSFPFGRRLIYRGQSRPWHLMPTAWRSKPAPFPTGRAVRAMREYIAPFMTKDDCIMLNVVGRIENEDDVIAIAQHYEVPTNFLDFTFDPLVALFFSLGKNDSPAQPSDAPTDCAVIYAGNMHIFDMIGGVKLHFPPISARRLYRQSGLFLDFGEKEEGASEISIFEENCTRVFFPRTYPTTEEYEDFVEKALLTPDSFFEQVAKAGKEFAESGDPENNSMAYMSSRVKEKPPWRYQTPLQLFIYDIDEFAHLWKILAGYLIKVAIVNAERHTYLDPVMINRLDGSNPRILLALGQDLPGILKQPGGPPEWEWISKAIPQSLVRFSEYTKRRGTLH